MGDYDKRTPLHLAASNGCLDAARFLVDDCQAELNAADRWGNGPLDDALRHEHGAVAKYLEARCPTSPCKRSAPALVLFPKTDARRASSRTVRLRRRE